MRYESELHQIELWETFRTSRGEADKKTVCLTRLGEGLGECCPSLHYGYSAEECHEDISGTGFEVDTENLKMSKALDQLADMCGERRSLLAGLDIALYDHIARKLELPLFQYLGLPDPSGRESSYTISMVDPSEIETRIEAARDFRILKLKLGSEYDEENLRQLKRHGGRTIRVDANGAYGPDRIEWLIRAAHDFDLELVEEPMTNPEPSMIREIQAEFRCPIVLDETVQTVDDIDRYSGCVRGINIKLQKVGGIRNALRMIEVAKSENMEVMIGCMLETSVGISASSHLCGLCDYIDLDSIVLLKTEPFVGTKLLESLLAMSTGSGHGTVFKEGAGTS